MLDSSKLRLFTFIVALEFGFAIAAGERQPPAVDSSPRVDVASPNPLGADSTSSPGNSNTVDFNEVQRDALKFFGGLVTLQADFATIFQDIRAAVLHQDLPAPGRKAERRIERLLDTTALDLDYSKLP